MSDFIDRALRKMTKEELEKMYDDAKKDKSFGGGFRQSKISRELNRRKSKQRSHPR